ncbi:MAG TPA: Gfo/Idh/MocA family oxidoreductase [Armatimonadota bacterium]|nr:Gfo/Idh/MocA family oxidoreductase [Armatimonadota bacterium]
MAKARTGFVGAGNFISAHHLLTARDSEVMEIRAIADLDEERLQTHASRMPVGYTTRDYTRLLADPDIDIVVIGTKQDLHAKMTIESLDAGKWVFCEKPMSETEEESAAVREAEARSPGRLAIGFNRRFAPAYADTKRLMQSVPRPWFVNYRLMYPNPGKHEPNNFYASHERILYEGTHILDLVCWLLEAEPKRVFMTGDKYLNNCCLLEFADGSQVSFMCGSMGSYALWKEYLEVFGTYVAIAVSDFVDMRVRGFAGEYDRLYAPHLGEHAAEIEKFGFDFYEEYKVSAFQPPTRAWYRENFGMVIETARRPTSPAFNAADYGPENPDLYMFIPDKGWYQSLEHFAECYLNGSEPQNADAKAGALSTRIALALLDSLDSGSPVSLNK